MIMRKGDDKTSARDPRAIEAEFGRNLLRGNEHRPTRFAAQSLATTVSHQGQLPQW